MVHGTLNMFGSTFPEPNQFRLTSRISFSPHKKDQQRLEHIYGSSGSLYQLPDQGLHLSPILFKLRSFQLVKDPLFNLYAYD